jgi:hypothetical protein|nr:MAG TPA: hypothetical protein [Caudoviricetes sp.]
MYYADYQMSLSLLVVPYAPRNIENQQIIKEIPNFTPNNVKLGIFIIFKISICKISSKRHHKIKMHSHGVLVYNY